MPIRRPQPRALAIALGLALGCGAAAAETSPWYIGVSQAFGYDSNVFRRPDEGVTIPSTGITLLPESSGTISTTRLLGGFDIYPSRQHIYANVSVDRTRYGDQSQLDTDGYGLTGGMDWETLERLSGTVRLSAYQRPGDYADPQLPSGRGRVLDMPTRADFVFRLGDWQSRAWLEAGYFYTRTDSEVKFAQPGDYLGQPGVAGYDRTIPTDAVSFGGRYRFSSDLVVGADLRYEEGGEDYTLFREDGSAIPTPLTSSYERKDIDFIARWTASGASNVNARLSYSKSTYAESSTLPRADYSGPTASVNWTWQPTGKLQSVATVSYDTSIRGEVDSTTSSTTTTNPQWSLGWDLTWAATAKVTATAGLRWSERKLETEAVADQRTNLTLGVRYAVLRNVTIDCSVGRESRSRVGSLREYDATIASCGVQALLLR